MVGKALRSNVHKRLGTVGNKEELPQQWKEYNSLVIEWALKHTLLCPSLLVS
jgi:hypothetical protein